MLLYAHQTNYTTLLLWTFDAHLWDVNSSIRRPLVYVLLVVTMNAFDSYSGENRSNKKGKLEAVSAATGKLDIATECWR